MFRLKVSDRVTAVTNLFKSSPRVLTLCILLFAAFVTFSAITVFKPSFVILEEQVGSLSWRFFSDQTVEERITIVSIDERSLSELGPWPWSRTVMANLSQRINKAGAQLQIHDIVYPDSRSGDSQFREALATDNNSVIAQLPILNTDQRLESGLLTHPIEGISCLGESGVNFPEAQNFLGASSNFSGIAKGHITPIIDSDGAIRRMPAVICSRNQAYPALSVSSFLSAVGSDRWEVEVKGSRNLFKSANTLTLKSYPGLEIPMDSNGNVRFSFYKSPSSFRAVSAVDVLNDEYDVEMFDNVWVLIGATAFSLDDVVPTPYSGSAPGVELQARMLGSILDNKVPYVPQGNREISALLSAIFGGVLFLLSLYRGRYAIVGIPLFSIMAPVISFSLYSWTLLKFNLLLGWLGPALFAITCGSMLVLFELVRVRFERGRVMQNLASYLPADIARRAASELPSSNIETSRCEVTLLCADLRNFSALGESRPPEESALLLHYFFTKVNSVVELHGGKVHEYKGDSVLAYWNNSDISAAGDALRAAQQIDKEVNNNLLCETSVNGLEPLAVGIGIEQGPVLMGSIGPAHRRAHTLCGETVSIALRIQEMTPELATTILIGEVASRHLGDFNLQSMGAFILPGLTTTHTLFAPEEQAEPLRDKLKVLTGGRK